MKKTTRCLAVLLALFSVLFPAFTPALAQDTVQINGESFGWDGTRIVEPESTMDPYALPLADATDAFPTQYPVTREEYALCPGAEMEARVTCIQGEAPGPVIYVVAGVHGDERGAWYAGVLLEKATIQKGAFYVLAPANRLGAENGSRYVTDKQDLNRSFPGDPEGSKAQRLADAIYRDIEAVRPDLVLDLHEAIVYRADRDFLGSTLIYTSLDGMADYFFDLLFATQTGDICSAAFGYNGPGPEGSVNRAVTQGLGIPAVTVETFRGYPMERRVRDQLDIVAFSLRYYGMLP